MHLLLDYISFSYSVLIVLAILAAFMIINRKTPPPASLTFQYAFALIFLLTLLNYADNLFANRTGYQFVYLNSAQIIRLRQVAVALIYIIEPIIMMLQIWIVAPDRRYRVIGVIVTVLNTMIYVPAAFGAAFAFRINESNGFNRGPFGYTIYATLILFTILLYIFSVRYFQRDKIGQSIILMVVVVIAFVTGMGEITNTIVGYTTDVIAASTLAYYLYLTAIHQQAYRTEIAEKKLLVTQQEMTILREQIQPHFIYNSLNIIRSLIRKDSRAAVQAVDHFSDYLQAHFRSLRYNDLISFEQELENVNAYLALAEADYTRKTQIIFDLEETHFMLPSLCLEPIVENAIMHGTSGTIGVITISTHREEAGCVIEVADNGTGGEKMSERAQKRIGVGIDNTRKRLKILCGGTLEMQTQEKGTTVRLVIPQKQENEQ